MSFDLPDIFKPRVIIAVALAALTEWGLSYATGVDPEFSYKSFVVFALVYVLLAWLLVKAYDWLVRKKKPTIDEFRGTGDTSAPE